MLLTFTEGTEHALTEIARLAPHVLTALNTLGLPFIAWGLITLDVWIALFGLAVHMAGKNWFLDRMALLHDDMVTAGPEPWDTVRPANGGAP